MASDPGSGDEPRPQGNGSMLGRLLGLTALTLVALSGYFLIAAQYLDSHAYAPADHALVTALRVLAGACAIPAFVCGVAYLDLRDKAIMRAQDAARKSSIERAGGAGADPR
jgi:hypothetical protein